MTVSASTGRIVYEAPGSVFPVPFSYASAADVKLTRLAVSTGVETLLLLGADYSLSGGNATLTAPLVSGQRLAIALVPPLTQTVDLVEGGRFSAEAIERGLDNQARVSQGLSQRLDRALVLPVSTLAAPVTMEQPAPGAVLRWDDTATRVVSDETLGAILADAASQAEVEAARDAALAAAAAAAASAASAQSALTAINLVAPTILDAGQKAAWALNLMGLANGLTQLMRLFAIYAGQLYGLIKDYGWGPDLTATQEDYGWGDCPATCVVDYGWGWPVAPMDNGQAISLPILVPSLCPIITPVPPSPPPVDTGGDGEC